MRYYKSELSRKNPYYISKHRLCELRHYCMQYNEWKESLKDVTVFCGVSEVPVDSGDICDSVPKIAEKREKYLANIELVEKCAKETDKFFWNYILLGVTTDSSYNNLRLMHDIPCCKNTYYQLCRKFFYILSQRR